MVAPRTPAKGTERKIRIRAHTAADVARLAQLGRHEADRLLRLVRALENGQEAARLRLEAILAAIELVDDAARPAHVKKRVAYVRGNALYLLRECKKLYTDGKRRPEARRKVQAIFERLAPIALGVSFPLGTWAITNVLDGEETAAKAATELTVAVCGVTHNEARQGAGAGAKSTDLLQALFAHAAGLQPLIATVDRAADGTFKTIRFQRE